MGIVGIFGRLVVVGTIELTGDHAPDEFINLACKTAMNWFHLRELPSATAMQAPGTRRQSCPAGLGMFKFAGIRGLREC